MKYSFCSRTLPDLSWTEAKRPQEIWVRDSPVQTSLDVLDSKHGKSYGNACYASYVRNSHCEQTPLFAVCKTNRLKADFIFIKVCSRGCEEQEITARSEWLVSKLREKRVSMLKYCHFPISARPLLSLKTSVAV